MSRVKESYKKYKSSKYYKYLISGEITEEQIILLIKEDKSRKKSRATSKERKKNAEYFKLDRKIYIHKYYPWCYENYRPSLVLQGWYNVDRAKKSYLKTYGPKSLDYVKFIKGKEAVEKGFCITHHLYINGGWKHIQGKHSMFHPSGIGLLHSEKREIVKNAKGTTGYLKRISIENNIRYRNNGSNGETIFKDTTIKKVRLQATKAAINRGVKSVYEEEPSNES